MTTLPRSFYDRDTTEVARELLGKLLVLRPDGDAPRIGRIVETEAYIGPHDLACHASKGMTTRTRVMFGPPGHAYIYLVYGMHYCLNTVTESEGHASAVLLRAIEPLTNISGATNGPGRLCKAMGIDRRLNAWDLTSPDFYVAAPDRIETFKIMRRPRIGVDYAGKRWAGRLLRFYIRGNRFVSKP